MSGGWDPETEKLWDEDSLGSIPSMCQEFVLSPNKDPMRSSWAELEANAFSGLLPFDPVSEMPLFGNEEPLFSEHASLFTEERKKDLATETLLPMSSDSLEDQSYRGAFKESFINASRCQSPTTETVHSPSDSTPSSSSMIALHQDCPGLAVHWSFGTACNRNKSKSGHPLGIPGCHSSARLRLVRRFVKADIGVTSSEQSEGSEKEDASDADSDASKLGRKRIDLRCKGETLSDSEDWPHESTADFSIEISCMPPLKHGSMSFIPVSNTPPSNRSCASASTSVGSPERMGSPVGKAQDVEELVSKHLGQSPVKPVTLTEKLISSLQSGSRGPSVSPGVQQSTGKPNTSASEGPKMPEGRTRGVIVKNEVAARRVSAKTKKTPPPVSIKTEEAPARNRVGRPKKLTTIGAEFKSSQGVKRRRALASKSARTSQGQSCSNCSTHVTPVWRHGPDGPKTLCNACGVRYMKVAKRK